MEPSKKYLHDRLVLLLISFTTALVVIGVGAVLLRFDVTKNPTTIVAYRPSVSGSSVIAGKPIDIYSMAVFMVVTAVGAIVLSERIYAVRRSVSMFILGSNLLLLILAIRVAWSIISIQ